MRQKARNRAKIFMTAEIEEFKMGKMLEMRVISASFYASRTSSVS